MNRWPSTCFSCTVGEELLQLEKLLLPRVDSTAIGCCNCFAWINSFFPSIIQICVEETQAGTCYFKNTKRREIVQRRCVCHCTFYPQPTQQTFKQQRDIPLGLHLQLFQLRSSSPQWERGNWSQRIHIYKHMCLLNQSLPFWIIDCREISNKALVSLK